MFVTRRYHNLQGGRLKHWTLVLIVFVEALLVSATKHCTDSTRRKQKSQRWFVAVGTYLALPCMKLRRYSFASQSCVQAQPRPRARAIPRAICSNLLPLRQQIEVQVVWLMLSGRAEASCCIATCLALLCGSGSSHCGCQRGQYRGQFARYHCDQRSQGSREGYYKMDVSVVDFCSGL